ncbi:MAG: NAD(+) synthase [Candidatus Obscuribacterales bacterium]
MTANNQSKGAGKSALAKISNRALGFVRVATVSPRLKVADCQFNVGEIISAMKRAQADNVEVLVTPELSITGYTCADLFHQTTLIEGAKEGLKAIVDASEQFDGIVFVGAPLVLDDKLYNCAIAIKSGIVLGVVPKSYLPSYKEFYEQRWFACAEVAHSKEIEVLGRTVQFGNDLLFHTDSVEGLSIAVDVCEDLWAVIPPSSLAALNGATLIVNLSASNELVGKSEYRRDLVVGQSGRLIAGYAYVSSGVDESTTDVVFGGHAMIALDGTLLQESPRFSREAVFTVADLDIERLRVARIGNTSFSESQRKFARAFPYRKRMFRLSRTAKSADQIGLLAYVDGQPFVPKDGTKLKARCEDIFSIQVAGLAKRLEKIGGVTAGESWPGVTIGVSGGLDSTLALLVTVKAFDLLGIDRRKIKGYTLPGFGTTSRTKGNAHSLMNELGITAQEVDIREMCLAQMRTEGHKPFGIDLVALDAEVQVEYLALVRATAVGAPLASPNEMLVKKFTEKLIALQATGAELKDLHFENVQARARTKILMDNGFTIGTGDLSELAIGWCTYNGDHMSMYGVNGSIPKTLVKLLVRWAANNQFEGKTRVTLLDIFNTEISPELLPTDKDGKIVQKTESVVGPYELTDFFLYHMLRNGTRPEKILALAEHATFETKYSTAQLHKWLRLFLTRFFNAQFKRSCLPDGPKVGSISLSPRGDWRMPSDAEATLWLEWAKGLGGSTEPESTAANAASDKATNNQSSRTPMTKEITTAATPLALAVTKVFRVLLRVDIQKGFCPGGNLAIPGGDLIVPVANRLSREGAYDEVIDSQDFHPKGHGSFASQYPGKKPFVDTVILSGVEQKLWTDHCEEGTPDADFHADLDRSMVKKTVQKGRHPGVDSYSAFYDNGKDVAAELKAKYPFLGQSTGLAEYIIAQATAAGADEVAVDVIGLAFDICAAFTAKHSAKEQYKGKAFATRIIRDGCRAFGDADAAAADLVAHGVAVIDSAAVLPAAVSK